MFTKAAFEAYMLNAWREAGISVADDERVGPPVQEIVEQSASRNSDLETPYIDLWIAIFDEFISWTISLTSAIYLNPSRNGEMSDFEKSTMLLLSRIVAETTAMRHLIELGFDTSARTLLRSVSEYLQVLLAIIHDPHLSAEFVKADTPEAANQFWHNHLAKGKLSKRTKASWLKFFGEDKNSTAAYFSNQAKELGELLSGTTHPSFSGGYLAVTQFVQTDPDEKWLGLWGAKSEMSVLTVSIFSSFFFPLLLVTGDFPFSGHDEWLSAPIRFDDTNEFHRHVRAGRSVLGSLILSFSKESNIPHIFPEGYRDSPADHTE